MRLAKHIKAVGVIVIPQFRGLIFIQNLISFFVFFTLNQIRGFNIRRILTGDFKLAGGKAYK